MRRVFILFLITLICTPSFGQILFKSKEGNPSQSYYGESPIERLLFRYRALYDRYPNNKQELLCLHKEEMNYYGRTDTIDNSYFSDEQVICLLKDWRTKLSVRGDTCNLYIGKYAWTIKCIGGVSDMQSCDYSAFRSWIQIRCFDNKGKIIHSLSHHAPSLDDTIRSRFVYRLVIKGNFSKEEKPSHGDEHIEEEFLMPFFSPVMIPFSMSRSGKFCYDLSKVNGWLFYYEKPNSSTSRKPLGVIALEDAIDQEYINAIRSHLEEFLRQHPEVETIKTWEYLLFNDPPKEGDSTSYL